MNPRPELRSPDGDSLARIVWCDYGMLVILALLFIGCSCYVEGFFTEFNMKSLALAISTTGMVTCTMMFILASGNFDLSCGAVIACSGVVAATVINRSVDYFDESSVYVGILAALLFGLVIGLLNGLIISYAKINALITTLATMEISRGLAYLIGNGKAVGIVQENFFAIGTGAFLNIPIPVYITAACLLISGVVLEMTSFGRNTLAIGGNEEAANLAGIQVAFHKLLLFAMHGMMSAFAGVVLASRMTSGQPTTSQGFELNVISACVLGGISMSGGVASIWFAITGVLIMGIVPNVMALLNVQTFYQYLARGGILLVAVIFDRYKPRR